MYFLNRNYIFTTKKYLKMSKTALIIVDPQNDFCQNGSL
jgi:hypothetical protein